MPQLVAILAVSIGGLWLMAHAAWTVVLYRSALDHNQRVEAIGALAHGLSGVAIALTPFIPNWLSLCLLVFAIINMALGRAIYELACMRAGLFHKEAV